MTLMAITRCIGDDGTRKLGPNFLRFAISLPIFLRKQANLKAPATMRQHPPAGTPA